MPLKDAIKVYKGTKCKHNCYNFEVLRYVWFKVDDAYKPACLHFCISWTKISIFLSVECPSKLKNKINPWPSDVWSSIKKINKLNHHNEILHRTKKQYLKRFVSQNKYNKYFHNKKDYLGPSLLQLGAVDAPQKLYH